MAVDLLIARRHLAANKKQTLVAVLGVTFGIAMFILMISFMTGVNAFMETTMLSLTPDIHIYNDIKTDYRASVAAAYYQNRDLLIVVRHPKPKKVRVNLKNAENIVADLKKNPLVAGVSPMVSSQVFYNYGPVQINGYIEGVDILAESAMFDLKGKMVAGQPRNLLSTGKGIIMGSGLATKLNLSMGDMVTLATPDATSMRFRVVGIFRIGVGAVDDVRSYVTLASGQQLLGKDRSYMTDISLQLKDKSRSGSLAAEFAKRYGDKADDWESANSSVSASNLVRDVLTCVVSITLLVVAGFGIYNIMNMTIKNKLKDIAILKAQGFAGKDIMGIFLTQSVFIGLLGALSGLLLGYLLSLALSRVPFPKNDYVALDFFPVNFSPAHYIFGLAFGLVTPFIAGLLPSLKASKIDPVIILRG